MDENREKEYTQLFCDINEVIDTLRDIELKARLLKLHEEFPESAEEEIETK